MAKDETKSLLDKRNLLKIVIWIGKACAYLEDKSYVHRDISARNVLVELNKQKKPSMAKLSDFGLAKDLEGTQEYVTGSQDLMLPSAHCAPECFHGQFSIKSDVWAFGVFFWEVLTWGETPFAQWKFQLHKIEIWVRENRKTLLDLEDNNYNHLIPEELQDFLQSCWMYEKEDRPTFNHKMDRFSVLRCLQKISKKLDHEDVAACLREETCTNHDPNSVLMVSAAPLVHDNYARSLSVASRTNPLTEDNYAEALSVVVSGQDCIPLVNMGRI